MDGNDSVDGSTQSYDRPLLDQLTVLADRCVYLSERSAGNQSGVGTQSPDGIFIRYPQCRTL